MILLDARGSKNLIDMQFCVSGLNFSKLSITNRKIMMIMNANLNFFEYFRYKGWKLKNVPFSFYPWCIQSELSLVKHGQ